MTNKLPALLALCLLASAPSVAFAQYAPTKAGSDLLDPAREARVQALGKKLRCAVCQGLSIWDSGSSVAVAQVDVVRRLISEGKTDEEVKQYFIARYGEWILLEPEAEGFNLIVWLAPLLLVGFGLWVIGMQIRKGRAANDAEDAAARASTAAAEKAGEPAKPAVPADMAEYLARVRQEVER